MMERTIRVATHGRYLIDGPDSPSLLVIGFHGYAESAAVELERLKSIPGSDRWLIVAVQGLHLFYRRRTNEVVASWMTSQDRDLAIADNIAYTAAVLDAVVREVQAPLGIVLSGFSQGVAMAYRCAAHTNHSIRGLISLGGDVPPELDATALGKIPAALLGRGDSDDWYTAAKFEADEKRMREAKVEVRTVQFQGGHEWTEVFRQSAADFLESRL